MSPLLRAETVVEDRAEVWTGVVGGKMVGSRGNYENEMNSANNPNEPQGRFSLTASS